MRRPIFCGFLLLAFLTACASVMGCVSDRPRPDPTQIGDPQSFDLVAHVHNPANDATILAAKPLDIRIFGEELKHNALTGVAFVVRRNGIKVDSVAVHFSERPDTAVTFVYQVPDFPTNTHLTIFGLAFGPNETFGVSDATLVTVIRCAPGVQGC